MTENQEYRIVEALERIATALEPAPIDDSAEKRIAKIEGLLGDPLPGVTAADWAKVLRAGKRVIGVLRKVTRKVVRR